MSSEGCSECDGYQIVFGWDGEEVHCTSCSLRAEVARLRAEVERLRAALQYIEQPTMSLPGGADAEHHVLVADERAVRLALQTCIRMARQAMGGPS